MTADQYKAVAARITGHCIEHRRFVYDAIFEFDHFTLELKIRYTAGNRYWRITPDKFRVEYWRIPRCDTPVHFDPSELLRYLR